MNKKYFRTPNLVESIAMLFLFSLIPMAALFVYIDDDYFFKAIAGASFFIFIYYFCKFSRDFFFNVLEVRENQVVIPGRKFAKESNLPDNSYRRTLHPAAQKKIYYGDYFEYRITKANIKQIRAVTDKAEIAQIYKERALENPAYSMVTNKGEIRMISFAKPVRYFDGEELSDRRDAFDTMYISVRDFDSL